MNTAEHITWRHHPFLTIAHHPTVHHPAHHRLHPPSPPYHQLAHPWGLRCSPGLPAHSSPDPTSHEQGYVLLPATPKIQPWERGLESGLLACVLFSHMFPARKGSCGSGVGPPCQSETFQQSPFSVRCTEAGELGPPREAARELPAQCCLQTWAGPMADSTHVTRQPLPSLKGVGGASTTESDRPGSRSWRAGLTSLSLSFPLLGRLTVLWRE